MNRRQPENAAPRTNTGDTRQRLRRRAPMPLALEQRLMFDASATFKAIYQGTPSAWSLQASSITTLTVNAEVATQGGSTIKFIGADPSATYFSGNNVAGRLVYTDASGTLQSINGVISRQLKTGGNTNAFYFYATGADGLVTANGTGDAAYLLQVTTDTTTYANGTLYRTSSDPVATALNNFLDTPSSSPSLTLTAATSFSTGAQVAIEAGGANNGTVGQNGTGNVLDSSLTGGVTTGLDVISVGKSATAQTGVANGTTSSNGTQIVGSYGTLTMGDNGTYKYVVDNTNATVQALRSASDTLTESFTYVVKRSSDGSVATTTLTVTIDGKNDNPVAVNDYNTTKIGGNAVTGNVLANDTDVDKYGEALSLGLAATGTVGSYTAGGTALTFSANQGSSIQTGHYVYVIISGSIYQLYDSADNKIQVTSINGATYGMSGAIDHYKSGATSVPYSFGAGATAGFNANDGVTTITGQTKTATVNATSASSTLTVSATGIVSVGMTVTGTGIPNGTKVTAVSVSGGSTTVTLDNALSGTPSGTVSFADSVSAPKTITGVYGTLTLNTNGSYSYTPNASGSAGTDRFGYTMTDASGATASATLNVQVLASSTVAASNAASSITAEQSTNTVTGSASSGVVGAATGDAALTASLPASIVGLYGTLQLQANGSYTYTLDNGNAAVAALGTGRTLTDSFQYLVQGAGGQAAADIIITINGTAHAPTLQLDPAAAATNYVAVYSQGSSAIALASLGGSHIADVDTAAAYSKLTLAFTKANFADGAAEILSINGATGSNTSIANLGGLVNGATGSFTLSGINYSYAVAVSGGTATITFTPASAVTLGQAEGLLTALRYRNTSSNPTEGSSRAITFDVFDNSSTPLASNLATATITVYNDSPLTVVPAAASVSETGPAVTGNVITEPTASTSDVGSNLTVAGVKAGSSYTGASSVSGGSTSASNGTVATGSYGTLTIGADGSYSYAVDTSNSTVTALNNGQSLNDVFTYQVNDDAGHTRVTTLTVTINGVSAGPDTTADAAPTLSLRPDSDPGPNDSYTNATPSVRVTLNGSGATAPSAGDVVKIYLGTSVVGTATLAAGDLTNGYVDITTSSLGADGSKNLTATLTDAAGNESTPSNTVTPIVDTTAPLLSTATVNGSSLVLTYAETGSGLFTTAPSAANFTVMNGASAVTVSSVAIDTTAKTITLTLASAAANGDTVTVSYDNGGAGPNKTEDFAGNLSASFSNHSVTNNTPAPGPDTTADAAPTLSLRPDSDPGPNDSYTNATPSVRVTLNGSGAAAPSAGDVVKIYLGTSVVGTATLAAGDLTNGYVDITTSSLGADGSKNLTATLTDAAGNESTPSNTVTPIVDTTAPLLSTATVNGTSLVLTYTETGSGLFTTAPSSANFTVMNGATSVAVSSVAIDTTAKTITLTLASAAANGDTVTVSYDNGGAGPNKTEDFAGNLSASFSNRSVTNNTAPASAPTETVSIVSMTKDTGSSATDFVTADGSAGRVVAGTVSSPLGPNEIVQVSFDGGTTWVAATTSGTNWTATDNGTHAGSWTIKARVANTVSQLSGTPGVQDVVLQLEVPKRPDQTPAIQPPAEVPPPAPGPVVVSGPTVTVGTPAGGDALPTPLAPLVSSPLREGATAAARVVEANLGMGYGRPAFDGALTQDAAGAARIVVIKSDEPALLRFHGVPDQSFNVGTQVRFQLPPDAFVHTQENAVVRVTAERADGGPLPGWLKFDATTGKFVGKAPAGSPSELAVLVTARDNTGREAATVFRIKLTDPTLKAPAARLGLSDQLRDAAQRSAQPERQAKLERIAKAMPRAA